MLEELYFLLVFMCAYTTHNQHKCRGQRTVARTTVFLLSCDPRWPGGGKHLYQLSHFTSPWWIFMWGIKYISFQQSILLWTRKHLWLSRTTDALLPHSSLVGALRLQLYLELHLLWTRLRCTDISESMRKLNNITQQKGVRETKEGHNKYFWGMFT